MIPVCPKKSRSLQTAHGTIAFPAFIPVTTFGDTHPLDKLVRPYLKRTSPCLMISYYYAQHMKKRPNMPVFIDSGGFAGLFEGAEIVDRGEFACIRTRGGEELNPLDVLHFQIQYADIGATLDCMIPPGLEEAACRRRQELTIRNALYAQQHNIAGHLALYASLQCWDEASARYCARIYADAGFDGIAIGGMVPRAGDPEYIKNTVRAVREEAPDCAIHVFGCGNIELIPEFIAAGADSFDSSSYVRGAVDTRKTARSAGLHSGLYAAIDRVCRINAVVRGGDTVFESTANAKLCMG